MVRVAELFSMSDLPKSVSAPYTCVFVEIGIDRTPITCYIIYICVYIYIPRMIRYVYSVDYVICSIYVCICAAAIFVLSATFELTE